MTDNTHLMGDFMEIHYDIMQQTLESKAPKFIKFWRRDRYLKRLKKSIYKLANSKIILDRDNLAEYFVWMYETFKGGNFKSTFKVVQMDDYKRLEAVLKFDDIYSIIKINDEDQDGFDIVVRKNGYGDEEQKSCTIRVTKLYSNNPYTHDLLTLVNKQLLVDMSEFLDQFLFGNF